MRAAFGEWHQEMLLAELRGPFRDY